MNTNAALTFAPRAASRLVRVAPARKLVRARVLPALRPVMHPMQRTVTLAPSAGARIETVLMGVTFMALAGLAITMEAVGVVTSLLG
ncbi:MAG TPA: hypothetical protein VGV37_10565 [Aliidongia sp.]|uniref:hypothetical protein n=1 Tax=Aliidongia sp. TaxID=1914230 RepID=UPI002DDCCF0F|nr:hypothetical protein [Aliidongia sp.]HEV2674974.1 hypothetical protein [Aliidongia sp.]